jgi:pSer/pThr/pTyr-binding forkhead associated (FHA) protein
MGGSMPRVTIVIPDRPSQPYWFPVDRDCVTFGRGSANDVSVASPSVSVKHAEMRRVPGGFELVDVGSTNGLKVNGERQKVVALADGAELRMGEVLFEFRLEEGEAAVLARDSARGGAAGTPERVAAPLAAARRSGVGLPTAALLLGVAFVIGWALRYERETGESFLKAVFPGVVGPGRSASP